MADGITDSTFASGPRSAVDAIPNVPSWEVEERAHEVVNAAVRARQKEFVQDTSSTYDPNTGEEYINYIDMATGELYVYQGDDRWMKAATGEQVGDPRNVDPAQYQWVLDKFKYFHERWSAYPAAMAIECENAKAAIQSGQMAALNTVGNIAWNNWGGDAQRHFTQYFLDPFAIAVTNQQLVLDELAVAMYAYEGLLKQSTVDAKSAADETIRVLDGLHDSNPPDATTIIKVAAITVSIVAAVATGGTSLGITLGLIGAGLAGGELIASGIADKEKPQGISGGTVDEVLGKLREALDALKEDMDTVEQNLANGLTASVGQVDDWLGSDDPLTVASILPNEPTDDSVPNVTGGEVTPGSDDFRPSQ
jgi:hypothetical protein